MRNLKGKVAVVLGATGGVGAPISKRLSEEGMIVVLSARNEEELIKLAKEIDGEVDIFPSDATDMKQVEKLFDFAQKIGNIELVVSAVGEWKQLSLDATPEEAESVYRQQTEVFVNSAQNVGHIVGQIMMKQEEGGTLVHFSSHVVYKKLSGNLAYTSAKVGASALIEIIGWELEKGKHYNVRFVDFQPGGMQTKVMHKRSTPEQFAKFIPMSEIADAIVETAKADDEDVPKVRRFESEAI